MGTKNELEDFRLQLSSCKNLLAWHKREMEKLKVALADAIGSEAGAIPDSAMGLVSREDLDDAEARRHG